MNGRELAVVAYLQDHVVPPLIGRDPLRIEDIWQYLYKGAYWRRGPITMAAIAGIDMALWDIKAKAAGMPLYQLLGGAVARQVMVYTHADGLDIAEAVEGASAQREQGSKRSARRSAIPGLPPIYGTARELDDDEPADDAGCRTRKSGRRTKYLPLVPKLFEAAARGATAGTSHLLHDTHHRLTPIEAARLGKDLEPYRLFWLEDAVPAEHAGRLPPHPPAHDDAACGRRGVQHDLGAQHADRGAADRLHPRDPVHAGGVTGSCAASSISRAIYMSAPACHGAMDMSPIAMGANLHLDLCGAEFRHPGIFRLHRRRSSTSSRAPGRLTDGYLHPGEAVGHGVDIDEKLAAKYPYQRAYLPVNRLEDGTLWQLVTEEHDEDHRHQALSRLGRHPQPAARQGRDRRGHFRLGRDRPVRPREGRRRRASSTIAEFLVGRDPMQIGALWQEMYRSQYFEGGRVLHGGDLGDRHRAARHQGQGARRAGLPAARRQAARPHPDLRHDRAPSPARR